MGGRNEAMSQFGRDQVMIHQDDLKHPHYGDGVPEVLFDRAEDPRELVDPLPGTAETCESRASGQLFEKRRNLALEALDLGFGLDVLAVQRAQSALGGLQLLDVTRT